MQSGFRLPETLQLDLHRSVVADREGHVVQPAMERWSKEKVDPKWFTVEYSNVLKFHSFQSKNDIFNIFALSFTKHLNLKFLAARFQPWTICLLGSSHLFPGPVPLRPQSPLEKNPLLAAACWWVSTTWESLNYWINGILLQSYLVFAIPHLPGEGC